MVSVEANRALTLKRGQSLLDLLISHANIPDGKTKTSRKKAESSRSAPIQIQGGLHPPGAPEFCSDRSLALGAERYFPHILLYWVSQAGLFKIGSDSEQ